MEKWKIWVDRGGTFTDVIAYGPNSEVRSLKLLSQSPHYPDAIIEGIYRILKAEGIKNSDVIRSLEEVRIGTTIGTNALLERKGKQVLLAITEGFSDLAQIRYQNRPDIFARKITPPPVLHKQSLEIRERVSAKGEVETPLDLELTLVQLENFFSLGYRCLAICLMNSYLYQEHELKVAELARSVGFDFIFCSASTPLKKIVRRCDTTVVDAYITPLLQEYLDRLKVQLPGVALSFMQSHGGLCPPEQFRGPTSLLSGPAGGLVGAVKAAKHWGMERVVTFDMGGTSTDVSLYKGELPIKFESTMEGIPLRIPMLDIYTVAAGGGSILYYDGASFKVGPESAGAFPGPACYRNGGPLTVTDANLFLGRIKADLFPSIFGPNENLPPDVDRCRVLFEELADQVEMTAVEVAQAFLNVATENMASALRKVSTNRGIDLKDYALCSFGGAGAQVACLIAERLNLSKIYIHPLASLLSAYGIGSADHSQVVEKTLSLPWEKRSVPLVEEAFSELDQKQSFSEPVQRIRRVHLKLHGSDFPISIEFESFDKALKSFRQEMKEIYGFESDGPVMLDSVSLETRRPTELAELPPHQNSLKSTQTKDYSFYSLSPQDQKGTLYKKSELSVADEILGPALIQEKHTFIPVDTGWVAKMTDDGGWILNFNSQGQAAASLSQSEKASPEYIEIFNRRFMTIAEEMGEVLQKTAQSINIKERLDYSCAVFSAGGDLLANAPHMPVHLGSMGETVKQLLLHHRDLVVPGNVIATNSPYHGGTHIPDVTVINPVFDGSDLLFFTAARGHHADIGGKTPGSMPSDSRTIEEEGILFHYELLVRQELFLNKEIASLLSSGPYPARNIEQNLSDLKAQVASTRRGAELLLIMTSEFGRKACLDYVGHVLDYGAHCVERVVRKIQEGQAQTQMDNGAVIALQVRHQKSGSLLLNFSGTSPQVASNFNAPYAVTRAAAAYVFRCLVEEDIPLNEGCFRHLEFLIPEGCLLNPLPPAAVVAGNVETSQAVVDTLFLALGEMAASQGTMNNLSFGTNTYQYYETVCGGTGAGPGFNGASGIHSHMTNSRLTDPEVLEERYPVKIRHFGLRKGSGGVGEFHGGDGVIRTLEFGEAMKVSLLTERRKSDSPGLLGGGHGKRGENWWHHDDALFERLPSTASVDVQPQDWITIETPGGGGYKEKSVKTTPERHLYFAFGSNMNLEQMQSRCSSATPLGRRRLENYRLSFSIFSEKRNGGVADISTEQGNCVWGVLYEVDDEDLIKLDKFESTPHAYRRVEVSVMGDEPTHQKAWSYMTTTPDGHHKPHPYYWYLLYRAAFRFNFPRGYIRYLESFR